MMFERIKTLEVWLWKLRAFSFKWTVQESIGGGDDSEPHLLARAYDLETYRKKLQEQRSAENLSLEAV